MTALDLAGDAPPTTDAPAPAHRPDPGGDGAPRRRWPRRVVAAAVVLALLGGLVASRRAADGARDDLAAARAALGPSADERVRTDAATAADRADLARIRGQLDALAQDLATRSDERAAAAAAVVAARRRLDDLHFTADVQGGKLLEQGAYLADMQACLQAADQALNLSSTGRDDQARDITAEADAACARAEAYLRPPAPADPATAAAPPTGPPA
ncbi:MAG: hypothetical protein U0Q07_20695 [Acidimicrobiales bacterium]